MVLWGPGGAARFDIPQSLHKKLRAHDHKPVKKFSGGLKLPNGRLGRVDDIACVHIVGQIHGADTGGLIPVKDSPLDGSGPAILGEKGAVDIYRSITGQRKKLIRKNPAIGNDHEDIGLKLLQDRESTAIPHLVGLKNRKACLQRQFLHRRKGQLHSPALGFIGLGKHPDDFKLLVQKLAQRGSGKIRGAHKNNAHLSSLPLPPRPRRPGVPPR